MYVSVHQQWIPKAHVEPQEKSLHEKERQSALEQVEDQAASDVSVRVREIP